MTDTPTPPTSATSLTPLKPAIDERELITARYSEQDPHNDRTFRTFEIVYPATATDDQIWERAARAVFGVDCLRTAARQLDTPPAGLAVATEAAEPHVPQTAPGSPVRPAGTLTDKQLKAIYAYGRSVQRLAEAEVDARCQELYGCAPAALSKTQASQFIGTLKGEQAA